MNDERTWDWDLLERAAALAMREHRGDLRKGSATPYVSHVWSVAALVMEHGGDSTQAAAALLHDVAEDHGGEAALTMIAAECGQEVVDLVRALSDSLVEDPDNKPPWRERKEAYLAHLPEACDRVLLISAADKLHNVRSMLKDHAEQGRALWGRFRTKSAADQFWYYEELVRVFEASGVAPLMIAEMRATLERLRTADEEATER
ncbi:HD domain-containing protein [Ornithinimicrobium panacihumi]|uniref:HD domain-containing protein n=1 Tax=Ornithinimicrobium panacihumi TaxID=2008449 RepID=UPI003F8B4606